MKKQEKLNAIIDMLEVISQVVEIDVSELSKNLGFINHPLANNIFQSMDDKLIILDFKNLKVFVTWKCNQLREYCKNVNQIFFAVNKPYRITLLEHVDDILSETEYNDLLKWIWTTTEFPNQINLFELVKFFKKSKQKKLMTKSELKILESLDEEIIIYRGMQGSKSKIRGLSWTTDLKKAKWFANRYSFKGKVYSAKIKKEAIFMYCENMGESEVVVNPFRLKEVKEYVELS